MKPILILLMTCLVAACGSSPIVRTEQDPAAAFDTYRAYAWKQEPQISTPLLKQLVVAAIDAELAARGWRLVPEPDADVVLVGNVSARDEQTIDTFYEDPGWNGWGWRPHEVNIGGVYRVTVSNFKVGTLVLDMFDADTKRAVWRATAEGTVPASQSQKNEGAMAAVHAMFVDFPQAEPKPK